MNIQKCVISIAMAGMIWCAPPAFAYTDDSAHTPASVEMALAEQLYDDDKYVEAMVHFKNVVLMDPTSETAFERLGNAYLLIDKPDNAKAIEYAERALALNPHNSEALITKAWALNQLKRYKEALQIAKAAAMQDTQNPEAFECIADAQRGLRRYEAALIYDNLRIRLDKDDPSAYWDRSETFKKLKRHAEAKADRKKARELEKAEKLEIKKKASK